MGQRRRDDPIGFGPGRALHQNGFASTADKKGTPEIGGLLMKQKIAMEIAIDGQQLFVEQFEHGGRLRDVAKGSARRLEVVDC